MEKLNFNEDKKIKIIFWWLCFITILLFITVLFLISDRNIINKKLNTYNTEISILENNKKQELKIETIKEIKSEKTEILKNIKNEIELLEKAENEALEIIKENNKKLIKEVK